MKRLDSKYLRNKRDVDEEKLNEVFKRYHETVNMSASELEDWSKTEFSKLASNSRAPIKRNLRLLSKPKDKWTNKDISDANKTIAFVARMKKAEQGKPARKGAPSKRDISLKNWAYNPSKKKDKIIKRGKKFVVLSEKNKELGEYGTKAEAVKRLQQIEHFKQKDSARRGDSVCRIDRLGLIHTDKSCRDKGLYAELTDEGFLRCKGRIARTGPQLYMDSQGNEWIEFRPEEEVFKEESMKSFEMVILTDEHPPEMITADNVAEYQKGYLGSNITRDGKYMVADILITDKDLIRSVLDGEKVELSNGYFTTVIDEEGVCPDTGTPYFKVQTDIFGNHCSVVEEARGGPECRLYMDSGNAISGDLIMKDKKDAKVKLGDKEYEVPEEVAKVLNELMGKVRGEEEEEKAMESEDEMLMEDEDKPMKDEDKPMKDEDEDKAKSKPMEDEEKKSMDALKAKIDMLEAQLKRSKVDSFKIDARVNLVNTVKSIVPDCKTDGISDIQLMKSVVSAVTPSMKGKLDGAEKEYVRAAYEMALDAHQRNHDSNRELINILGQAQVKGDAVDKSYDDLQAKVYGRKDK